MSIIEAILEDEQEKNIKQKQEKDLVSFRRNNFKITKLEKKVNHKPRLFDPTLINLSIILTIIASSYYFFTCEGDSAINSLNKKCIFQILKKKNKIIKQ